MGDSVDIVTQRLGLSSLNNKGSSLSPGPFIFYLFLSIFSLCSCGFHPIIQTLHNLDIKERWFWDFKLPVTKRQCLPNCVDPAKYWQLVQSPTIVHQDPVTRKRHFFKSKWSCMTDWKNQQCWKKGFKMEHQNGKQNYKTTLVARIWLFMYKHSNSNLKLVFWLIVTKLHNLITWSIYFGEFYAFIGQQQLSNNMKLGAKETGNDM